MATIGRVSVLLLATSTMALAQNVLTLTNGVRLQGRYDGGNANTVTFIDDHGNRHKFNIKEIQSLVFNGDGSVTRVPTAFESDRSAPFAERGHVDTDITPSAGWHREAILPAGTEIAVRTVDAIEVRHPDPRQHFLATIERDVPDSNGSVVIPRGSPAHLIVHDVGDGEIAIDLRSVSAGGRRYILNAENITNARVRDGVGANSRTSKFVGGGALLGTVLGAIGGGGKGAAIGALTGAAAGAGTQVLTRGTSLHIPSETLLTFRLDRPVYLYE